MIGISYGSHTQGTFKLPDARGRVLGGIGQGYQLTNRTLGQTAGEEEHTLTVGEMPNHTHTVTNTVRITGNNTLGSIDNSGGELDCNNTYTTTTSAVGGGGAHNNMQPTLFIGNVFIFSNVFDY
jgi:microcystin-dependent protein